MSKLQVRVAATKEEEDDVFQPVDQLPEDLIPTSMQVMKFSGQHLSLEEDNTYFDWPGFKTAIDHYTGDDLSFDRYDKSTINQQSQEAGAMIDKVAQFLKDAFNAVVDMTQLAAIILNTFTNLKEHSESGFLQFSKSDDKHNSSWEYRVLFSVPFQNTPSFFYSLVTTIKITADIEEESSWWGLTSSTKRNFGVQVDALQLVVQKGFRAPIPSSKAKLA
ncbi:delta-endotoxin CytB [Collybia nuda]|uniref:Delta-endotoxin CytB n=1 Tax=Collybia nuda TaxID=64659 RepID=A0A9P5YE98_9AGAR|nr:delta-endotoxin CytB [Collybia nuda]